MNFSSKMRSSYELLHFLLVQVLSKCVQAWPEIRLKYTLFIMKMYCESGQVAIEGQSLYNSKTLDKGSEKIICKYLHIVLLFYFIF